MSEDKYFLRSDGEIREVRDQDFGGSYLITKSALVKEASRQHTEIERLRGKLVEAYRIIKQAKQQFAPNTTNSDADDWLKRNKDLEN